MSEKFNLRKRLFRFAHTAKKVVQRFKNHLQVKKRVIKQLENELQKELRLVKRWEKDFEAFEGETHQFRKLSISAHQHLLLPEDTALIFRLYVDTDMIKYNLKKFKEFNVPRQLLRSSRHPSNQEQSPTLNSSKS